MYNHFLPHHKQNDLLFLFKFYSITVSKCWSLNIPQNKNSYYKLMGNLKETEA